MDCTRYSTIAHRDHMFCSPLGEDGVHRIVARLELPVGASVLDVGCGKGEMLIQIVERYQARGVGVDPNPVYLEEARWRAHDRVPAGSLQFHQATMAEFKAEPESYDAVLCVGATQAFGGYRDALRALRGMVRDGGLIVVGEWYWKRTPAPGYLEALGAKAEEHLDHAGNCATVREEGLTPLFSVESSPEDWDEYEGLAALSIERYVAQYPRDSDADAMRAHALLSRDAYLRWGRDTLGFGIYVMSR